MNIWRRPAINPDGAGRAFSAADKPDKARKRLARLDGTADSVGMQPPACGPASEKAMLYCAAIAAKFQAD